MASKNLKILQLNKRDADLHNRIPHINEILNEHKPNLMIINELNLHSKDLITKNQFPNYTLITDDLGITDQQARTGILIEKSMRYKRRKDLENHGTSTIWIQINKQGAKPLLIQAIYRQFQRLNIVNTKSIYHQKQRWEKNT